MNNTSRNPWMGPSSYQDPAKSGTRTMFCGRENETFDLTHLVDEKFLVTLYGKSGNGKTSLLQAGVFPALRREMYVPVMVRLGMAEEGTSFQRCIREAVEQSVAHTAIIPVIEEQADEQAEDYLWNYFARHRFTDGEGMTVFPVFVFDQFEEVLRTREALRRTEAMLAQLSYITDESHALADCIVNGEEYTYDFNFRFVISIREDELYRLEDCIDNIYMPTLKRCRYRLNALTRSEARTIILRPGGDAIREDERDEIVRRVTDLATNKDDGNISSFMLSLICSELFKKACAQGGEPLITLAVIDSLGQNILGDFYTGVVDALEEGERMFIEDNLVDANRMRNSVNEGMMDSGCPSWRKLTDGTNRILQATNGKVELVHDMLAVAVADVRERRKEEERLMEMSREKEEMRKRNRRKMAIVSVAGVAAALTIAFMIYQNIQSRQANWHMMENQSRAVAGKAIELANGGDSYTARLLALEALPKNLENPDRPYTEEAEYALRLACNSQTAVLQGHKSYVHSAFFSPDGKRIVSASSDNTIRIWDVATGTTIGQPLRGHEGEVYRASFSPDGTRIVSSSADRTIRLWDAMTGNQIGNPWSGHEDIVLASSFSIDGQYVLSTSLDNTIRVWKLTGKSVLTIDAPHVFQAYFSPDSKKIVATFLGDCNAHVFDAQTGERTMTLRGHTDQVESAVFNERGSQIITASMDKTVRVWDAQTGEQLGEPFFGHTAGVYFASEDPRGSYIVSSSEDKTIRIWDAVLGNQIGEPLTGHSGVCSFVTFSPDGRYIVSGADDNTIRIWESPHLHENRDIVFIGHQNRVNTVQFSPDGTRIATSSNDKTIRIWNAHTGGLIRRFSGHTKRVNSAFFSPDGKYIVSASMDGTVRVLDVQAGKTTATLCGHDSGVHYATFSPDGKKIVSASQDNTVRVWTLSSDNKSPVIMRGHTNSVLSATFSPDGKKVVSSSLDNTLRIWDAETGEMIGNPLVGHTNMVCTAYFSPDGKRIVSASADKTIRLWNAQTGKQIGAPIDGHSYVVGSAVFSSDGKYIISSSYDSTVRVWDAQTGNPVTTPLNGYTEEICFAAISPDGKQIATAGMNGKVTVTEFDHKPLQQLIDETRERFKNRKLTAQERRKYFLD